MKGDSGVYILKSGGVPVYVGSSIRMQSRVRNHPHIGKFDSVSFLPCPESELLAREQEMLDKLKPPLNMEKSVRRNAKRRMDKPTSGYPFNLLEDDAEFFSKIKSKVEKRLGISLPTVHIIRLALIALSDKEGVK